MQFKRKLLYFGIGLFLGILMVKFFFGGRDIQCSYFPNDRVLHDLRGKKRRIIKPEASENLRKIGVDTALVSQLLWEGEVDFAKSNTNNDSCNTYWIDFTGETAEFSSALFMNCDTTAILVEIKP